MNSIKCTKNSVILTIRVVPRASQNKILEIKEEYIKISVKAPPVDNKANEILIGFLSKILSVAKSVVRIRQGLKGKNKLIEIATSDPFSVAGKIRVD